MKTLAGSISRSRSHGDSFRNKLYQRAMEVSELQPVVLPQATFKKQFVIKVFGFLRLVLTTNSFVVGASINLDQIGRLA